MYKSMIENNIVGRLGEAKALEYCKAQKYEILEKNYRNKLGEIDIICFNKKEKTIVFVEVKYRSSEKFGMPREAVNAHKQHKIKLVATMYLTQTNQFNQKVRFDVIEILSDQLTHIKNAF